MEQIRSVDIKKGLKETLGLDVASVRTVGMHFSITIRYPEEKKRHWQEHEQYRVREWCNGHIPPYMIRDRQVERFQVSVEWT